MFDNRCRRGEQESTKKLLEKLEQAGVEYEPKEVEGAEWEEKILAGKTFVFTGRISMPREEAKDIVECLEAKRGRRGGGWVQIREGEEARGDSNKRGSVSGDGGRGLN